MRQSLKGTNVVRWLTISQIVWAVAMAALLAADGSWGWRLARPGVIVTISLLVYWLSRKATRASALLAILCGMAGVMAGIAFGPRFLMVEGLSWKVVVGFIGLVSGLALLVLGLSRLTLGWRRVWKWTAIPGLSLIILFLLFNLAPAVLATNLPPILPGQETPADFNLKATEERFKTADGVELSGWYISSRNGASLVLRHGSGSTASSTLAQAAVLVKNGYGVLITDARGHGNSHGRAMDFGWYGEADINAALAFLKNQPGVDAGRIGVVGLSMGGEEAIGAAAQNPLISAVVAEGATGRIAGDKNWMAEAMGLRGSLQLGIERLEYGLADWLTSAQQPSSLAEAALKAAPHRILLITAGEVEDEAHAAVFIQKNSPSNVSLWTVAGAGHTGGLATAPQEWERRVVGFLNSELLGP